MYRSLIGAGRLKNIIVSYVLLLAFCVQLCVPVFANEKAASSNSKSYISEGMKEFKNSFSGVGTPAWLLEKFGVSMGYHLIECFNKKEKPDVVKVFKSMATADYAARSAGAILGGAAGSIFVPFLSAVPIFGGLLANFVPTLTYNLGAELAGEGLAGQKKGRFSFKKFFRQLDWTSMIAGSLGWSVGSILGSAIFPPIGGIVGGILGDVVAGSLLKKFREWRGKGDRSPPGVPTKIGGPVRVRQPLPVKSALAPSAAVSSDSLVSGKIDASDTDALMALTKKYEICNRQYYEAANRKDSQEMLRISRELDQIQSQIHKLRNR